MPTTTPLNVLDELYLHLDREDKPWSVHAEIRRNSRSNASPWRRPFVRPPPATRSAPSWPLAEPICTTHG